MLLDRQGVKELTQWAQPRISKVVLQVAPASGSVFETCVGADSSLEEKW